MNKKERMVEHRKSVLSQPYRNVVVLSGRVRSKRHISDSNNLPLCKPRIKKNEQWQIELNKCDCRRCLKIENAKQKISG